MGTRLEMGTNWKWGQYAVPPKIRLLFGQWSFKKICFLRFPDQLEKLSLPLDCKCFSTSIWDETLYKVSTQKCSWNLYYSSFRCKHVPFSLLKLKTFDLTHSIWQIRPLFSQSKWNMGVIWNLKFLKFLHALTMSFLLLNFDQKNKFSKKK